MIADDFTASTMVDAICCIDRLRRELVHMTSERDTLRRHLAVVTSERDTWRTVACR